MAPKNKYDIFISYRRDDGAYTAKAIFDSLRDRGYRVFLDIETLRSSAFNLNLYNAIDECQDFIIILSPHSLDRCVNENDWVRRELEYALSHNKNVIPVFLRGFEFPDVLPEPLEPLRFQNGIPATTEFYDAFIQKLEKFLFSKRTGVNKFFAVKFVLIPVCICLFLIIGAVLFLIQYFENKNDIYNTPPISVTTTITPPVTGDETTSSDQPEKTDNTSHLSSEQMTKEEIFQLRDTYR